MTAINANGDGAVIEPPTVATICRAVSYGGGVQSTALLVLAAQGVIDFPTFLFSNTGEDSELPETLRYVREVAVPFAAEQGIELVELQKTRFGKPDTIREALRRGRLIIPARREKDGPPLSRSCTVDFKIGVVSKELKRRGATPEKPAIVALGISVDEIERSSGEGVDPRNPVQHRVYPLLTLGLHRRDCMDVIAAAGLPVPPPSSCWFCPNHDREAWRSLKRTRSDLFAASCALEGELAESKADGRPVFLTRAGRPLGDVIDDQQSLWGDDCDSGWCFT